MSAHRVLVPGMELARQIAGAIWSFVAGDVGRLLVAAAAVVLSSTVIIRRDDIWGSLTTLWSQVLEKAEELAPPSELVVLGVLMTFLGWLIRRRSARQLDEFAAKGGWDLSDEPTEGISRIPFTLFRRRANAELTQVLVDRRQTGVRVFRLRSPPRHEDDMSEIWACALVALPRPAADLVIQRRPRVWTDVQALMMGKPATQHDAFERAFAVTGTLRSCARPSAVEHLLAANAQRERLYVEVHGDHLLCAIGERTVEEAAEELRQLALALVPLVAGRPRRSRSTASSR